MGQDDQSVTEWSPIKISDNDSMRKKVQSDDTSSRGIQPTSSSPIESTSNPAIRNGSGGHRASGSSDSVKYFEKLKEETISK